MVLSPRQKDQFAPPVCVFFFNRVVSHGTTGTKIDYGRKTFANKLMSQKKLCSKKQQQEHITKGVILF